MSRLQYINIVLYKHCYNPLKNTRPSEYTILMPEWAAGGYINKKTSRIWHWDWEDRLNDMDLGREQLYLDPKQIK